MVFTSSIARTKSREEFIYCKQHRNNTAASPLGVKYKTIFSKTLLNVVTKVYMKWLKMKLFANVYKSENIFKAFKKVSSLIPLTEALPFLNGYRDQKIKKIKV